LRLSSADRKGSLAIKCSLLIKSFDDRFSELLDDLKYHREIWQDELALYNIRTSQDQKINIAEQEKATEERRCQRRRKQEELRDTKNTSKDRLSKLEKQLLKMQAWIKPPDFVKDFEETLYLRASGTNRWIFENPIFWQWRECGALQEQNVTETFGPATLWVHGISLPHPLQNENHSKHFQVPLVLGRLF
jgi:hypothetical protein